MIWQSVLNPKLKRNSCKFSTVEWRISMKARAMQSYFSPAIRSRRIFGQHHASLQRPGLTDRLRNDRHGDSDKLSPSRPDRYSFAEHRHFLNALWDALTLGDRVILVLHD